MASAETASFPDAVAMRGYSSVCRPLCVLLIGIALVLEFVARPFGALAPHQVILDPLLVGLFGPSTLGAFAMFLMAAGPLERASVIRLGLLLETVRIALEFWIGWPLPTVGAGLGPGFALATLVILCRQVVSCPTPARGRIIDTIAAVAIIPLCAAILPFFLWATIVLCPRVYDVILYRMDASMGFQPSEVFGALFLRFAPLRVVCGDLYMLLPVTVTLAAALEARSGTRQGVGLLPNFVAAACLGYFFYFIMPAVGPSKFFGAAYPFNLPTLDSVPHWRYLGTGDERNAMPSLHTAWAVLALLATRGQRWWVRGLAAVSVCATLAATLGFGEHYAVDLVVAALLVVAVRALGAVDVSWRRIERWGGLAASLLMLVVWCALVGDDTATAALGRNILAVMLGTIVLSIGSEHLLSRCRAQNPAGIGPIGNTVGKNGA